MPRSLPKLITGLVVIPVALVLIATRLTSGATFSASAPSPSPTFDAQVAGAQDTAYFAGGCFWGIEGVYEHVKGVKSAVSGYSGGSIASPTYDQVTSGDTGHAETVRVIYDPAQISYGQLLRILFSVAHDPTQLNRQGPDRGTQYRSAIFYHTPEQKRLAEESKSSLEASGRFQRPIVTEITAASTFYPAEDYHQRYLEKRGLASCHV